MNKGKRGEDERGETTQYYKHIINEIPVECCEDSEDSLTYLCDYAFKENLITGQPNGSGIQEHDYTYGQELHFENGFERTMDHLKEHPESRRAVIPLFKTKHIGKNEVPCMVTTIWDIEPEGDDDYLNLTILGRSNECAIAMKSDIKGYAELVKYAAYVKLEILPGTLLLHDVNAHVRINSDMDEITRIIKEGF
jgi:thymidylate synthase